MIPRLWIASCSLLLTVILVIVSPLHAQWHYPPIAGVLPNSAVSLGNDCFQMTSGANTLGVVWDSTQINLSQPFDITLSVNQQPWGGDGIALVLQSAGLAAFGAGANALGYGNSLPPTPGYLPIVPSVAFEVDTWDNTGAGALDIPQDHVAIHKNGDMTTTIGGPVPALASGLDVTDGLCHTLRVTWNPGSSTLQVFFDNNPIPRINIVYNMVALVFGGNPMVWWGITGGLGGTGMVQTVCVGANFAQVGPDRSVCSGDTLQLHGYGGIGYAWQPGAPILTNGASANPVFGPASAGTYTVSAQVTNAAGCTDGDTTMITVDVVPTANPGPPVSLCIGDSVQLGSPTLPNQTYQWSPATALDNAGIAQPFCHPLMLGVAAYRLIVVNVLSTAGCADTAFVTVTAVDTPSIVLAASPDTICLGSSSMLNAAATGGVVPYSYLWSNGATIQNPSVSPMVLTNYQVTVSEANGCTTTGNIAIAVNDTPHVSVSGLPDTICSGNSATLTASVIGGLGPFSYVWSSGGNAANEVVNPSSTSIFHVTVTDPNGCTGQAGSTIVVLVVDSVDIRNPDTIACLGGAVPIQNTYGSAGVNTWLWTPITGVSSPNSPNTIISPTVSTTYYLLGTNSITGCSYQDSIYIAYVPLGPPVLNLGVDTLICTGDTLSLDAANPTFMATWNTGATTSMIDVYQSGTYAVTLADTQGCGFLATDSLILSVQPLPAVKIGNDTTICQGDSISLTTAASGSLLWSTGSTQASIVVSSPGMYGVSVTDSFGCVGSDTLLLGVQPLPVVSFANLNPSYCITDPATTLIGSPIGGVFTGTVGNVFDPASVGSGSHTVTYAFADSLGCSGIDSQSTVVSLPPSAANAGPDQTVDATTSLAANVPGNGTGHWAIGTFTGTISGLSNPGATVFADTAGTFPFVWVIDNPPCPASQDTVWITFDGIVIPTGFSPNGDGVNDQFVIKGLLGLQGTKFQVFNRWGGKVWSSDNYQNDWSGQNANGQPLVEDTYYAIIESNGHNWATFVVLRRE